MDFHGAGGFNLLKVLAGFLLFVGGAIMWKYLVAESFDARNEAMKQYTESQEEHGYADYTPSAEPVYSYDSGGGSEAEAVETSLAKSAALEGVFILRDEDGEHAGSYCDVFILKGYTGNNLDRVYLEENIERKTPKYHGDEDSDKYYEWKEQTDRRVHDSVVSNIKSIVHYARGGYNSSVVDEKTDYSGKFVHEGLDEGDYKVICIGKAGDYDAVWLEEVSVAKGTQSQYFKSNEPLHMAVSEEE